MNHLTRVPDNLLELTDLQLATAWEAAQWTLDSEPDNPSLCKLAQQIQHDVEAEMTHRAVARLRAKESQQGASP